jgi:hypothetical protein
MKEGLKKRMDGVLDNFSRTEARQVIDDIQVTVACSELLGKEKAIRLLQKVRAVFE